MPLRSLIALIALLALAACASSRGPTQPGAGAIGSYKIGKPYQVAGVWYYPAEDWEYDETGIASWYGPGFNGKKTANGETYNEMDMTAAHKTLPLPVMVKVTNLENGKVITVRINDRGPFVNGRIIDLSRRAAQLLGVEQKGTAKVRVQILADETRQLIAVAQSKPGSDAVDTDVPEAAPTEEVEAKPLDGSAPTTAPATTSGGSSTTTNVPWPDDSAEQVAVGPTQIYIQAGAFRSVQNAEALRQKLTQFGDAVVYPAIVGDTHYFRVRVGPLSNVNEADDTLQEMIAAGYSDAKIVIE